MKREERVKGIGLPLLLHFWTLSNEYVLLGVVVLFGEHEWKILRIKVHLFMMVAQKMETTRDLVMP